MAEDTQMKQFKGDTPLECRQAFEDWFSEGSFPTGDEPGDHYYEVDTVWAYVDGTYVYSVLYQLIWHEY